VTDPVARHPRLLSGAMLGLASGAILVPLNSTMLAVALPSVMTEFGVGAAEVASLVTLYLGAVAIALPASGSLGDRFGHRRIFLLGVVGFAVASTMAATAGSFEVLAGSRILQAVTGALVSTTSVALLRALAPDDRRGSAFGLFDMLVSISAALGPIIGGLLVAGFGWRAIFVVAVPVATFAAVAVGVVVPPAAGRAGAGGRVRPRPIDLPGLALLAAFLVSVLAGIGSLGDPGSIPPIALAAPFLLAGFVWFELRVDHPAVDPRLFARRSFSAAVVGILGSTVILHATLVLVPLLIERVVGAGPQVSGLVLLGISAAGAISAPLGGRWSDVIGRRWPVLVGSLASAAALGILWLTTGSIGVLGLGVVLGIIGFGMGLAGPPRQAVALETIEPERVGMAAGTYLTGRYIGGAVGATLAGAVLGAVVTAGGVATGFGLLTVVGLVVAAVSVLLPGRVPRGRTVEGAA
jgi:EmrB/QacA subfamily drug resistance transporter